MISQTYIDGELVETVNHGGSENQLIGGSRYDEAYSTPSMPPPQPLRPAASAVQRAWSNPPKATIDFETRSACAIKDCGSWRYSLDPSTEVMCLVFRLPHWELGRTSRWNPALPDMGVEEFGVPEDLAELKAWILGGGLVEAHNAWFERGIWTNVMVPRHGWFPVRHEQWRCSAAKAASYGLPRSLDGCTQALKMLVKKDVEGKKLMLKMCKPRKARKAEVKAWQAEHGDEPMPYLYHGSVEQHERLCQYCETDVLAEEGVSHRLRDLNATETQVYLMDQYINEAGFQIDGEAVEAALDLVNEIFSDLNEELVRLTEGKVLKATQRAKMIDWFAEQGVSLPNTQGPTLDEWLKRRDLPEHVHRCLQLVRSLGRSSTAKYLAAQNWADPATWRIHGGLLYHGAGTGRWSGAGLQPHNFPRGNIKNMELAWETLKSRDVGLIEMLYGDVMNCLSFALRGMIIPKPGKKLFVADYAAIEARVVFWLADDQDALDIFRRKECIYMAMATDIYGRPITDKVKQADERQLGKQAVLGLGYQMGGPKFVDTCAKYNIIIDPEFSKFVVDKYRNRFWRVKEMWWNQEAAAIAAVKRPGQTIKCGKVQWRVVEGFLHCRLPSGRLLGYADPLVVQRMTPWGAKKDALTFMGVDSYTKKWCRGDTYGGMLVENITQAVARDLMAHAMLTCHEGDTYDIVLSVHDELIGEADEDKGSVEEFEHLMASIPEWAEGCPVVAEGWAGFRYKK